MPKEIKQGAAVLYGITAGTKATVKTSTDTAKNAEPAKKVTTGVKNGAKTVANNSTASAKTTSKKETTGFNYTYKGKTYTDKDELLQTLAQEKTSKVTYNGKEYTSHDALLNDIAKNSVTTSATKDTAPKISTTVTTEKKTTKNNDVTTKNKDGSTTVTTYDKNGKKTKTVTTKADGTTVTTKFDKNGKKTSAVTIDGTTKEKTTKKFEYDKNGKLTQTTSKVQSYDAKTKKYSTESSTVTTYKDGVKAKAVKTNADGSVVTSSFDKNGVKTKSVKEYTDGTKTTATFDKDGNKISSVKVDGTTKEKTITKYEYNSKNEIISAKTTTQKINEKTGEYETAKVTESEYKNGLKTKSTTRTPILQNIGGMEVKGLEISSVEYSYDKDGNMIKSVKTNADGTVKKVNYDVSTGKPSSAVVKNADGQVTAEVTYNVQTGEKVSKNSYTYGDDGKVSKTRQYSYDANGELQSRKLYDANGELSVSSNYTKAKDGTMVRKDYAADGKYEGSRTFEYDKYGHEIKSTYKDSEGNLVSVTEKEYWDNDLLKTKKTTNAQGSVTNYEQYDITGKFYESTKLIAPEFQKLDI